MPITVVCDCGKRYSAGDGSAGRSFQCKVCGRVLNVPEPDASVPLKPPKQVLDIDTEGWDQPDGGKVPQSKPPQPKRRPVRDFLAWVFWGSGPQFETPPPPRPMSEDRWRAEMLEYQAKISFRLGCLVWVGVVVLLLLWSIRVSPIEVIVRGFLR
jgi:hypothetical protein